MGDYIAQFVKEVVQKDVKGLLPQNLSDEWLEILSEEAEEFINFQEGLPTDEKSTMSALVITVLTILQHQQGNKKRIKVTSEELVRAFQNYIIALSAEEISRKTEIKVEPPTLENIFSNDRQVKVRYTGAAKE
ncbi:MAG TPA: hypothetical protein VJL89_12465 [Thermodesulfovibrionia bacterium]|nr:hypothetical protein [Thermodesulfovibrionia bacterium]